MNPKRLKFVAVWLLFAHLFDLYWVIFPSMPGMENGYVFSWIDFTFPIATIGFIIVIFAMLAKKYNLMPIGDPKIKRGLDFYL